MSTPNSLKTKVLQFGEGNFLRAFVDWMIQKSNDKLETDFGVVVVQPLANGLVDKLKAQDNKYHVILEGIKNGNPIREIQHIDCLLDAVNPYSEYQQYKEYFLNPDLEFVLSNTTEAGIAKASQEDIFAEPPVSFPGKVVALLHERYKTFNGDTTKGLHFICCELIEDNASTLHKIILELAFENNLGLNFVNWINKSCSFNNSLVDRIVTGFPKDTISEIQKELGVEDNMVVTAEYYHQWAIEAREEVQQKFPLDKAGLNIVWTKNMKAYRDKKVRILNGAHTALVPVGLLSGHETVKEAFADTVVERFIRSLISKEVIPTIKEDEEEVKAFADAILERFFNPFIKHYLKDISLNSLSKWVTRDLPSLLDSFSANGILPKRLTFSLAALLVLYKPNQLSSFTANDTQEWLDFVQDSWNNNNVTPADVVNSILSNTEIWGEELIKIDGIVEAVSANISAILESGVSKAMEAIS